MMMFATTMSNRVHASFECAVCGEKYKLFTASQSNAKARAKAKGWRLLRGDCFCGERCNEAHKASQAVKR